MPDSQASRGRDVPRRPAAPGGCSSCPFTTSAWRIWHIGADCLRSYGRFFGDELQDSELHVWPGTAAAGVQMLARDWDGFRTHVESLGDDGLLRPMGSRGGDYADESYLLLALHALDEVAHRGAELGVLRDLYRHGLAPEQAAYNTPDAPPSPMA